MFGKPGMPVGVEVPTLPVAVVAVEVVPPRPKIEPCVVGSPKLALLGAAPAVVAVAPGGLGAVVVAPGVVEAGAVALPPPIRIDQ